MIRSWLLLMVALVVMLLSWPAWAQPFAVNAPYDAPDHSPTDYESTKT